MTSTSAPRLEGVRRLGQGQQIFTLRLRRVGLDRRGHRGPAAGPGQVEPCAGLGGGGRRGRVRH